MDGMESNAVEKLLKSYASENKLNYSSNEINFLRENAKVKTKGVAGLITVINDKGTSSSEGRFWFKRTVMNLGGSPIGQESVKA